MTHQQLEVEDAAEVEMMEDVLNEVFLGVFGESKDGAPWYLQSARDLSRGSAARMLAAFSTAHAAGLRQEPRAAALVEVVETLLSTGRPSLAPFDAPAEPVAIAVARSTLEEIRANLDRHRS